MSMFRHLLLSVIAALALAQGAIAQQAVPNHRFVYSQNVDFYGSDLGNLFDTTQEACARACAAQGACIAFTFNARSNACFPKSAITDRQPYEGAISARKVATDPQVLAQAHQRQADLTFLKQSDFDNAAALVAQNSRQWRFESETPEQLSIARDQAEVRDNTALALRWAGMAAALSDRAEDWNAVARLSLQRALQTKNAEKSGHQRGALKAATAAYLRALGATQQVQALDLMARALEAERRGRAAIPALRLALQQGPRPDLQAALEVLIGKYGFRLTDHRVESDAAQPRICAEFSEPLVQAGVDYDPFVRIAGRGMAIDVQGNALCIDGVAHGGRYDLTLRQGLPAASGEALHRDVQLRVYVRDRSPSARFTGRAYVLPRSGAAALPVETVNASTLDLRLRRVSDRNLVTAIRDSYFARPLSKYEDDRFAARLAQEIWTGGAEVQNELNRDMTTRLPLGDVLSDQPAGIYTLSAAIPGQDPYDNPAAMQWFVLSDLGVSSWSGVDGMTVSVRSLADTSARAGIKVSLISRANAVLGQTETDADGFAHFPAGLTRGSGSAAPALLMAQEGTRDVTFLPLTDPAFDLSDRGVEGHPPAPPIDTFLATDRGAYRVGETIYATVLTRDARARALEGLPITAVLHRPDGVEYSRQLSAQDRAGGHVFALPLGGTVPRGAWRLDIRADLNAPPLASTTLLVEDFLPERIDFETDLDPAPLQMGATRPLDLTVRYLFGAPGADLNAEGELRLRSTRQIDGWPGFQFGRHDARFRTQSHFIEARQTDASGHARLPLKLPLLEEDPGLPLAADLILRVSEGSGRPVERRLTRPVAARAPMIGIKPLFDQELPEGAEARFELIGLSPAGDAMPMQLRWTLNRVETRYQWYQLYGNWQWEPTTRRSRMATGELQLTAQSTAAISAPTTWGNYELVVERIGGEYAASSVDFSAGWYGSDDGSDSPDRLALSLDAPEYAVGDAAQLRLVAPANGVALLSVLSNRVIERRAVPVQAGENRIDLTVTPDWGSGAYVTASVLRGMDLDAGQTPARSLGLVHAAVRPADRALSVRISAPQVVDGQAGILRAKLEVTGAAPGDQVFASLAAVDVGILNLTSFQAPDVTDHYFGQRRLGVELRDLYGRLIDASNGALGQIRSGGDAAASMQMQSPPPTEDLMAFFSGPIEIGPDGTAEVEIIRPAFNGQIRLMALAWSAGAVGDAATEVIARDPVVMTASVPRFMAPGDESRLLLELVQTEGAAGTASLRVEADPQLQLEPALQQIELRPNQTGRVVLPIKAMALGDPLITVVLTTASGQELRKTLRLPVRQNDPAVSVTRQFALDPGQSFTFDNNIFADLRPGTGQATLTAGPLARFDVPGLLRQLDRYPYGCTEQLTSGALPLIYLSAMAEGAGLGQPAQIRSRVQDAIDQVLSRQASNGGFGLWRAESGYFWLDAYVTDFLSRARQEGFKVPDLAFSQAMDNLRNRVNYAPDFDSGGQDLAYALWVLAREGAAHMGDLRYYADTKGDAFATPMAAAQLGAALASYGDPQRADAMFRRAGALLRPASALNTGWRNDFGSPLRDTAAVLSLSAEAGSRAIDPLRLLRQLGQRRAGLSTQEAAQVVLAAHALSLPQAAPGLRRNGAPVAGPLIEQRSDRAGAPTRIENAGNAPIDVTLTTFGVPQVAAPAGGYGYAITRRYFTLDGTEVSGAVQAGTRLAVVLEVTPFEEIGARLILDDPLPAGFEIDNPNLLRSGQIGGLDWLKTKTAQSAEFRADRFVAAVDHRKATPFRLAYIVRAVTPGRYHHPAALVEDMYRPEYRAVTGTGMLTVLP